MSGLSFIPRELRSALTLQKEEALELAEYTDELLPENPILGGSLEVSVTRAECLRSFTLVDCQAFIKWVREEVKGETSSTVLHISFAKDK